MGTLSMLDRLREGGSEAGSTRLESPNGQLDVYPDTQSEDGDEEPETEERFLLNQNEKWASALPTDTNRLIAEADERGVCSDLTQTRLKLMFKLNPYLHRAVDRDTDSIPRSEGPEMREGLKKADLAGIKVIEAGMNGNVLIPQKNAEAAFRFGSQEENKDFLPAVVKVVSSRDSEVAVKELNGADLIRAAKFPANEGITRPLCHCKVNGYLEGKDMDKEYQIIISESFFDVDSG
jgi:hypothetical protein